MTVEEAATVVIDTPAGMEMFKLLQCIHRLSLEIKTGMVFKQSTLAIARSYYGLEGCNTKKKALEQLEALLARVKSGELHALNLPIADRELDLKPCKFIIVCVSCGWGGNERGVRSENQCWGCPECDMDESGLVVYNASHWTLERSRERQQMLLTG